MCNICLFIRRNAEEVAAFAFVILCVGSAVGCVIHMLSHWGAIPGCEFDQWGWPTSCQPWWLSISLGILLSATVYVGGHVAAAAFQSYCAWCAAKAASKCFTASYAERNTDRGNA